MTQMLQIHKERYKAAFDFLSQDLPALRSKARTIWDAFLENAHLDNDEALATVTMDGTAPLIFASDLGSAVFGQFDPHIPGRIEIGIEVLNQFALGATSNAAQQFLRAKVLHEICHWSCFRQQLADNDQAGEAFERAAFGQELLPWWVAAPPTAKLAGSGDVFNDPRARADLLMSLLGKHGFAPGRQDDPNHAVFGGKDVAEAIRRGFRNNNPGNIRVGSSTWRGLSDPVDQTAFQRRENSFCVFREPEWGLRALAILLRKYKTEHGLDTPRKIIARWAPAGDNNDVVSYAGRLAAALGVTPDSFVDATDNPTLTTMMKAIAQHENGDRPPYAEMQYQTALLLV